jgi:hypothetical protein
MKANAEKTATLNLQIPNRALATILLERWRTGVSLNILRGRVTSEKAAYELEIHGSAQRVTTIVRQSAPWDAARRSLNPLPTGASA